MQKSHGRVSFPTGTSEHRAEGNLLHLCPSPLRGPDLSHRSWEIQVLRGIFPGRVCEKSVACDEIVFLDFKILHLSRQLHSCSVKYILLRASCKAEQNVRCRFELNRNSPRHQLNSFLILEQVSVTSKVHGLGTLVATTATA